MRHVVGHADHVLDRSGLQLEADQSLALVLRLVLDDIGDCLVDSRPRPWRLEVNVQRVTRLVGRVSKVSSVRAPGADRGEQAYASRRRSSHARIAG